MWGLIAICFALFANMAENLIQAVNIVGSIFYGVVLGMFLVAFFMRWIGGTAVFYAAIVSQVAVLVLYFTIPISYLWYNVIGCAICVVLSACVQIGLGPIDREPTRGVNANMSGEPVICFGQQPCGFFPRRYLVAKIRTARRLQAEIGGRIVFFCHDSDHDPRETKTIVRHRRLGEPLPLNFAFANKWQRKFSPLYAKRVLPEWQAKTAMTLHPYVEPRLGPSVRRNARHERRRFLPRDVRADGILGGNGDCAIQRSGLPGSGLRNRRLLCRRALRGRNCPRALTSKAN